MYSIRRQLLAWLLSGLLIGLLLTALTIYRNARSEANELFDHQIKQVAMSFPERAFRQGIPIEFDRLEQDLVVQVWSIDGAELYFSRRGLLLPQRSRLGFTTVATNAGAWRVFSALSGNYVVQVAQPMSVRAELAAGVALRTAWPMLLLIPGLAIVIWISIGRGLRPLTRFAAAIRQRSPTALQPLSDTDLPVEITPLVRALNGLLTRLDSALGTQQTFIADAAHELRTPLTAVQLQIQLAERAHEEGERAAAFAQLKKGLKRITHLLEQLLTLARHDPSAVERPFAAVDLSKLAKQVIAERAPLAQQKNLDLGMQHDEPVMVQGDREGLQILLGNLVDNAIHYTPAENRIDVSVMMENACPLLLVADSGPGISIEDRERVFDRFYRGSGTGVPGSGLGLAIVKNIAERHHAQIGIDAAKEGPGLVVTVRFNGER